MQEGDLAVFYQGSWAIFGLLAGNPGPSTVLSYTCSRYCFLLWEESLSSADLVSPPRRVSLFLGRSVLYSGEAMASHGLLFADSAFTT